MVKIVELLNLKPPYANRLTILPNDYSCSVFRIESNCYESLLFDIQRLRAHFNIMRLYNRKIKFSSDLTKLSKVQFTIIFRYSQINLSRYNKMCKEISLIFYLKFELLIWMGDREEIRKEYNSSHFDHYSIVHISTWSEIS